MYYLTLGFAIFLSIVIVIQLLIAVTTAVVALYDMEWETLAICGISIITLSITIPLAMWVSDLGEQYNIEDGENICVVSSCNF